MEKLSDISRRTKVYEVYSIGKKGANEGLGAGKCHNGTVLQEK